jgi:hypothetical protein
MKTSLKALAAGAVVAAAILYGYSLGKIPVDHAEERRREAEQHESRARQDLSACEHETELRALCEKLNGEFTPARPGRCEVRAP